MAAALVLGLGMVPGDELMELQSYTNEDNGATIYKISISRAEWRKLPLTPGQRRVLTHPGPISHHLLCLAGIARILETEEIRRELLPEVN